MVKKDFYRHFFFFFFKPGRRFWTNSSDTLVVLCVFVFVHLVFFYERKTDMHVLKCLPIGAEH